MQKLLSICAVFKTTTSLLFLISSISCSLVSAELRAPVIDMHVHAFEGEWEEGHAYTNPFTGEPSAAVTGKDLLSETLAEMKRYNVSKGLLSGSLNVLEEWKKSDPSRFIGSPAFPIGFGVNAPDGWPEMQVLEDALNKGLIGALGEVTTQYAGLRPDTPELNPYFEFALEHDIPVAIHIAGSGDPTKPKFRLSKGKPFMLEEVLRRYPELRIFVMHAGYPFLDEMVAMMIHYPQLYVGLGWISWANAEATYYAHLEGLVDAGLEDRIMFGSDQAYWPEAIGIGIERIENAPFLNAQQKRKILYNNAARFLKLEQGI